MKSGRRLLLTGATAFMIFSAHAIFAQTQNLPPELQTPKSNPDEEAYRQAQIQRTNRDQQMEKLRQAEREGRASYQLPRDRVHTMTDAERKRFEQLRAADPADLAAYKEFLRSDGTGIFRLFPPSNCETKGVIRVDAECANYVPGGSMYSFRGRTTMYDIRASADGIVADGFLSLSIVADLGNADLETVLLASDEIGFLRDYQPATSFAAVREEYGRFVKGQKSGEKVYTNKIMPTIGKTYAVRIIAYRIGDELAKRLSTAHPRQIGIEKIGQFGGLKYDNRADMIVAFRVIRRSDDGSITVLWKELSRKVCGSFLPKTTILLTLSSKALTVQNQKGGAQPTWEINIIG